MKTAEFVGSVSRSNTPRLISFSGMDGSGKSTQIDLMCHALAQAGFSIERLAFWDDVVALPKWRAGFSHKFLKSDGGIGAPGKPVNRNDKNNRAWYLTLVRYFLFFLDAVKLRRAVARASRRDARLIVFDRYIFDQLATLPLTSVFARVYAFLLIDLAPTPDVAYLLDAEPEVARQRKPEYSLSFLHLYRQSYLQLQEMAGLALVKPQSLQATHADIMSRFRTCLAQEISAPLQPLRSYSPTK